MSVQANDPCPSGVWYDTRDGAVVTERPEEGVQLVAPGDIVTADQVAAIESYGGLETSVADAPEVSGTDEPAKAPRAKASK